MTRRLSIVASLVLFVAANAVDAQQRDPFRAEFNMAVQTCRAAADSGSLSKSLAKLNNIATQNPNYPELKKWQDHCLEEHKKQRNQEDLLFEEAKQKFRGGAREDARTKFQSLASRDTVHTEGARSYLAMLGSAGSQAPLASSEKDSADLEKARRYFQMNEFSKARPLLYPLLNKTQGPEAKKLLDLIEVREKNQGAMARGMQAIGRRQCQEALEIFRGIRQSDPDHPGLSGQIASAERCAGATGAIPAGGPAEPATSLSATGLEAGINLFKKSHATGALKVFRALPPNTPGVREWIQKAEAAQKDEDRQNRIEGLVRDGEALLTRKEYARARTQFERALAYAPEDEEIRRLRNTAAAGMKQSGQTETAARAASLSAFLEDGVREFYAGNLAETGRLLEQYVNENGKLKALACFYLGAAASTEYFLGGEKDRDQQFRALRWFEKSRRLDSRFEPPRDWVSPKIIALFEKTRIVE